MNNLEYLIKGFKRILLLSLIFLSFYKNTAQGQTINTVNITVNIAQPYSPYYSDYSGPNASKVLLLVQNLSATTKTIKLTGQLQGDNGIKISTKSNYVPLKPIVLNPNETKQLNGLALVDIFDLNSLNVYGIDKSRIIYTSRLPEGNYTFCIQAVDMNTNQVISSNAPLGCTSITIAYPDAPIPLRPDANGTVNATQPQSVIFNWLNAGFVPTNTQYILQIEPMPLTKADPNQVLNSVSFPMVNKTVQGISDVLSPSDPPLKIGQRYAWRIKAIDPTGKVVFKNNGVSKALEFRYGEKSNIASVFKLIKPENKRRFTDLNELKFNWSFIDNYVNDAGFFTGPGSIRNYNAANSNNSKYELNIIRIKTIEEKKADSIALVEWKRSKRIVGNSNISTPEPQTDKGIAVYTNTLAINYADNQTIKGYVKDGNSYEWFVKDIPSGTVSETRNFTVKIEKIITDYTIALSGNILYNYYKDYITGSSKRNKLGFDPNKPDDPNKLTESEKGYPLAKKNVQVLKVKLLAPTYKVNRKIIKYVNGVEVVTNELQDSIALVSDLMIYPNGAPKLSSSTVIASGTTTDFGNFKIDVPINQAQYKVLDPQVKVAGRNTTYALVEGLVVRVDDNRFSDPNWYVFPNSDKTNITLPEQTVEVFGYNVGVAFTTKYQKNYKGKLYLLRNNDNVLNGEVGNIIGVNKDIPIYKTIKAANGKEVVIGNGLKNYTVVGVNDINVVSAGNLSSSFTKLAVAGAKSNDGYTVYFEPADGQDALYFNPVYISNGQGKTTTFSATDFAYRNLTEQVTFGPKFISMQVSGRYVYNWKEPNNKANLKLPLPEGTQLNLVRGNLIEGRFVSLNGKKVDLFAIENQALLEKIISTTTVKKNGEYSFDVGLTDYDNFNKEGNNMIVLVTSDYYFSDPKAIKYIENQTENVKVDELTATVRQYSYLSKIGYMEAGKLNRLGNMKVYLTRLINDETKNKDLIYKDRPVNVGDPEHGNYFKKSIDIAGKSYEIIDTATSSGATNKVGEFTFKRLLVSKNINEKYYIISESISTSQENYKTENPFDITTVLNYDGVKQGVLTSEQKVLLLADHNQGYAHVPVVPQSPYIDGAVYPNSNASTSVLSGVKVEMFNVMVGSGLDINSTNTQIASFLYNKGIPKQPEADLITQTNGRFEFKNFYKPIFNGWKLLRLTKNGFLVTYVKVNSAKPLLNGQRGNLGKVYMDLPKDINVTVVNEAGKTVSARIIVGDDFSWNDYTGEYTTTIPGNPPRTITNIASPVVLQSPYGSTKFTIIPTNRSDYKTTEIYVNVLATTNNLTFKVKNNVRTLLVKCKVKGTNTYIASNVAVLNVNSANVNQMINPSTPWLTNKIVEIASPGTQFDLRVTPVDMNYTIAKTQVHTDGTNITVVDVEVEPAVKLVCTATQEYWKAVKFGMFTSFEKATEKAGGFDVYVKDMDEDEYIINEGKSIAISLLLKQAGTITISRLPSKLAINVGVTKDKYIGEIKQCIPWGSDMAKTFALTLAPDMNVKSIYGFPMELTKAQKQANGQYIISGRLSAVDNGNLKSKSSSDKLEFNNVLVNVNNAASGKATDQFFTAVNLIVFNQNSIDAKLFGKYEVKVLDETGLSLSQATSTTGNIMGKVALDAASLAKGITNSSSENEGDDNYLYLNNRDLSYAPKIGLASLRTVAKLKTFSTAGSDLLANEYLVSTSSKAKPIFYGADELSIIPDNRVMLNTDNISFDGAVSTSLKNATILKPIKAKFTLSTSGFKTTDQQPFNIKLFQWQLQIKKWNYGATGFSAEGDLNALGLTVPFTDLQIANNQVGFGKFKVTDLKLLSAFPITIKGSNASVSFGYDKGYSKDKGAWSLSILSKANKYDTYLAGLKGLDDLESTDIIQIKNINLYDTGDENDTRLILDENQPAVTLNKIAKFKPGSIWGTSSSVTIRGDLNMEIPGFTGLDAVVYDLTYRAENGSLKHKHEKAFTNLGLDTKGMLVKFSSLPADQKFTGGELYLKGVLQDKDPSATYQIDVELTKNKNLTQLVVPKTINNTTPRIYLSYNTDKKLDVNVEHSSSYVGKVNANSESYLNMAKGSSSVTNNQWANFTFDGMLTNSTGIDPSPMSFTIKGDVVANDSKLGVQNMDAGGVKGLSIAYDFKEKALMGSGHINPDASFAKMDLDVEMKLGSSNWYIFSNGLADVKNTPFTGIGVGFMVGNSSLTQNQKNSFYKHFGSGEVPVKAQQALADVKGVLLMLSAEMPIPLLPSIDLDLDPIAHCTFTHGFYAAAYLKANFSLKPEDIAVTVGGQVGAFVKLSAGASIGLACAGISLGADTHADINGYLRPFAPSGQVRFSADMDLHFTLSGSAYVGAGICNSSCETPCFDAGLFEVCSPIPCKKIGLSKTFKLSVGAGISDKKFELRSQTKSYE